jgi:maltooligosyltrehalose synthase
MNSNPVSTYRIQFNKDFNFSHFEKIITYLETLGVKTAYASPIFESVPGSNHGYDGTNPNKINPEIGTPEQLKRISQELKRRDMYWLQDVVPNHLAFHENNKILMDVLAKGQSSEYASFFDVIWDHPEFNGKLMVPFPGSNLEQVLKKEIPNALHYSLRPWQETDTKINYRRFFLVNGLICTNIHDDAVFNDFHALIKKLVEEKIFDGLRVDHVDGLFDPEKYLHDLGKLTGEDLYIVVEKILGAKEKMPHNWHIAGSTGYDFLAMVNNLFTNREAEFELTALYYDITGDETPIEQQVKEKKKYILYNHMRGELDNLTRLYRATGLAGDALNDDETRNLIADYLIECPVYRFYGEGVPFMDRDKGKTGESVKKFYNRCMQFTGPLMAKGVEDTLMYTYNRFIGHNDVGDSPEFFGYSIDEFHEMMIYRQQHWPMSMNTTSTHDTKRGEDVRARLNALTCFQEEWSSLVRNWMIENQKLKSNGCPDRNDEYFIYQTLAGSFPTTVDARTLNKYETRLAAYLEKALREAKTHSYWTNPDNAYEQATIRFTRNLLHSPAFNKTFKPFVEKITHYGMINSFGQLVLKFTCPGIPDTYQGTERWDLSLVDPDNRQPVNYDDRARALAKNNSFDELWNNRAGGEIKLTLLHQLMRIRYEHNDIFTSGDYVPLNAHDENSQHILAFMRRLNKKAILVIVPTHYALINNETLGKTYSDLVPKNLFKRELLNFSDFFKVIHLDLAG